jgi:hypothetical protein
MSAEMGTFEAFYASAYQHPWLLWLAILLAAATLVSRRGLDPRLRGYLVLLVVVSPLDAWLTSNLVYGIGALPDAFASFVPLLFVLAGDFRFLFLVVAATPSGGLRIGSRKFAVAAAFTAIVPLASQLIFSLLPASLGSPRFLFLIYEVAFVLLTVFLMCRYGNFREAAWLKPIGRFVVLYYALWASADAIILATGSDLGFLLRVIPNILYYGGLIAAIAAVAPRRQAECSAPHSRSRRRNR